MKRIIKNQNGQGLMEYMIISCLVGIFCLGAMKLYGKSVKRRIFEMRKEINEHVKIS